MSFPQRYQVRIGERVHEVCFTRGDHRQGTEASITVDGHTCPVRPVGVAGEYLSAGEIGASVHHVHIEDKSHTSGSATALRALVRGRTVAVQVEHSRSLLLDRALRGDSGSNARDGGVLEAPMPGRVVRILVEAGQRVEAGQAVVIVEAMKMENELSAPRHAVVRSINVREGDAVDAGAALCHLDIICEAD